MSATIPPASYALFDEANFAHLATLMPDGSPQTTPVWIDRDGDVVVFNTARGRSKANNLARDPRVAISITDPANPYRYVQVRGRAELVDEGADAHIDRLAKKYLGQDTYPFRQPGEQRVIVRVVPDRVTLYDPR
jgi:PPOX class probable F420-dependent enzyme